MKKVPAMGRVVGKEQGWRGEENNYWTLSEYTTCIERCHCTYMLVIFGPRCKLFSKEQGEHSRNSSLN